VRSIIICIIYWDLEGSKVHIKFGFKGARKMPFGRPVHRWKENIEIYLKELW
jgi:hypothetical protein